MMKKGGDREARHDDEDDEDDSERSRRTFPFLQGKKKNSHISERYQGKGRGEDEPNFGWEE
jgi:hypothetical protein